MLCLHNSAYLCSFQNIKKYKQFFYHRFIILVLEYIISRLSFNLSIFGLKLNAPSLYRYEIFYCEASLHMIGKTLGISLPKML